VAFGRVDVVVRPDTGEVVGRQIHAPRFLCQSLTEPFETCAAGEYEGAPVARVDAITEVITPFLDQAREVEARDLGVRVEGDFPHVTDAESALGNLLADLIRSTVDGADVGLMNGGGIRDGIDEGALTYGELHAVFPFDNWLATARITGAELAAMVRRTLGSNRSVDSYSGIRVRATCRGAELQIELRRDNGRRIRDDEELLIVASDFLVTGGNDVLAAAWRDGRATMSDGLLMRDELAERLAELGRVRATARFDPRRPRLSFEGERAVDCAVPAP
jgi:5'-nucleotidase